MTLEPMGLTHSSGGMDAVVEVDRLVSWLSDRVRDARAQGFVYGLSGGIDSAVVGALTERATPGRNLALILPCHSQKVDIDDAHLVARSLGLNAKEVDLSPVFDLLASQAALGDTPGSKDLAAANLKARLRMATLYFHANRRNALVSGTGNRSELTVGYFTKYGDGGCDLLPIGHLVKAQVRAMAAVLGVPLRVITKAPTAGLWPGQTDENEMGITYEALDRYILTGEGPAAVAERIQAMNRASDHKRKPPPVPDWRG